MKQLLKEIFRYGVVGGLSFLFDFGVLTVFQEFIFKDIGIGLYLSIALGFIAGLIVNYLLSIKYVFVEAMKSGKGKSTKDFVLFTVIGVIGLAFTELGMHIGVFTLHMHYQFIKIIVVGIVFIWNYVARKIFIFH